MRYDAREFYLKSREEMEVLFKEVPESITNTLAVAEMCDVKLPFGENNYPVFTLPPEIKSEVSDNVQYLKNSVLMACKKDTRCLMRKKMVVLRTHHFPKNSVSGWIMSWG